MTLMRESASLSKETFETLRPLAARRQGSERRDSLREHLRQQPLGNISSEEIEVHFSSMPGHYWERVNEEDLIWGLETIHGFLTLIANPKSPPTKPFLAWRQTPAATRTRIMLCTWDRHGLLAKAVAAFSAVRLNILQADVFTRADNIVLDLFSIVDADSGGAASPARLQDMMFLLEGALSEPPRFASVWACSRHKFVAGPAPSPPRITFDNHSSSTSTIVRVEAADRLGLLYDILQTLADQGLEIREATIKTDDDLAHDRIHVTDGQGGKIMEAVRLHDLRLSLEAALTVHD